MNRPIIYSDEQMRTYDFLTGFREALYGLGIGLEDLLGSTSTVVTGLAASASSGLTIAVAAGRILQVVAVDTAAYSDAGTDSRTTYQHGEADAQTLTFVTSALSSGQSQYALVQASFSAVDAVPSDDPNSGILPYYDVDDASNSLSGPSGTGTAQSTRRYGKCVVSIKYGTPATTGSEVAPSADTGYAPLYLIDLAYGQTTITSAEIVTHSSAPFLAGLLAAHHGGGAGQAPQIDLTAEVKNVLPLAHIPSIPMAKLSGASSANAGGGIATTYTHAGNPNGSLAGTAGVAGTSAPDTCWDATNALLYLCTTTGTATTAVWTAVNSIATGAATLGSFTVGSQSSVTFPGWLFGLSHTLIVKFGLSVALSENSGATTIAFTTAFPTAALHAQTALYNPSGGTGDAYDQIPQVCGLSNSGIVLLTQSIHTGDGGNAYSHLWRAVGY